MKTRFNTAQQMAKSSTSWQPGQTGNPGGRPKAIAEVRELAQQYTEKAILRLVGILDSEKSTDAAVVSAAGAILDRAVGRPEQSIHQKNTFTDETPEAYMPDYEEMRRIMKGQRGKANSTGKDGMGKEGAEERAGKVSSSPARAAVGETDGEAEESDKVLN